MSDPHQLSRRYTTLVVAAISLIVITCVAWLVPVPYVTLKPGPAIDTLGKFEDKPVFTFGKDVKTYPTSGSLDFTTVSVTRPDGRVSLVGAMTAFFDPDVAVVPKTQVYPEDETAEQSSAASAAQLLGSKDSSRVAALRAAGYTVTGRASVAGLVKGGAAAKLLKVGDIVTAVDGSKVATPDAAVKGVGAHRPGETVSLDDRAQGRDQRCPDRDARRSQGQGHPAYRRHARREVPLPVQDRQHGWQLDRRAECRLDVRPRDLRQADGRSADRRQEDRRYRRDRT